MSLPNIKYRSIDVGQPIVGAGPNKLASLPDLLGVDSGAAGDIALEPGNVTPQDQLLIADAIGAWRINVIGVDTAGDTQVTEVAVVNTGEAADVVTDLHNPGALLTLAVLMDGADLVLRSTHTAKVNARVYFAPMDRPAVPTP
jgi:hypothetical protein